MYRLVTLLIYVFFIVRAIARSNRKWATAGVELGSWIVAVNLAIMASSNAAATWERWGIPSFIIPAILGTVHSRFTQPPPLESEIG
jgi:hypothetical protein